jgi:hypothetical protein
LIPSSYKYLLISEYISYEIAFSRNLLSLKNRCLESPLHRTVLTHRPISFRIRNLLNIIAPRITKKIPLYHFLEPSANTKTITAITIHSIPKINPRILFVVLLIIIPLIYNTLNPICNKYFITN